MLLNEQINFELNLKIIIQFFFSNLINTIKYNLKFFFQKYVDFINIFLLTVNSNKGLKVCFISIFVATILTIYEIIMFYAFVVPSIYKEIINGIFIISKKIKTNNINFNIDKSIILYVIDYFNITVLPPLNNIYNIDIIKNEKYIISDIFKFENNLNEFINYLIQNDNTKLFILSILKTFNERESILVDKINDYTIVTCSLLLGFLLFSLFIIKITLEKRNEQIGKKVWISSWFTILMILLFQYSFFTYANKYKYMGTTDINELIYYVLNYL
jgi:hypothetical protein